MKYAMISQPMANKTEKEILDVRAKAIDKLRNMGYEVIDTYYKRNIFLKHAPVYYLGQAIIEYLVAKSYSIEVIEESEE